MTLFIAYIIIAMGPAKGLVAFALYLAATVIWILHLMVVYDTPSESAIADEVIKRIKKLKEDGEL